MLLIATCSILSVQFNYQVRAILDNVLVNGLAPVLRILFFHPISEKRRYISHNFRSLNGGITARMAAQE